MTANPLEMVKGIDYDCLGSEIRCVADRDGARIFEVSADRGRIVRVLALYADEAEQSARDCLPKYFVSEDQSEE